MNGKERVKTAFRHQEADRVPVSDFISFSRRVGYPGAQSPDRLGREVRGKIRNAMLMEGRGKSFIGPKSGIWWMPIGPLGWT